MIDAPYLDTLPRCENCGGVGFSKEFPGVDDIVLVWFHRSNKKESCPGSSTGDPEYFQLSMKGHE